MPPETAKLGASPSDHYPDIPPVIVDKWQVIVDTLAELARVPAGLIMRISGDNLEVMISSHTPGNPYHPGESECFINSGLYCETVIKRRKELIVPNALKDKRWKNNPDVTRDMISYLGLPILWPDQTPFGTICILDNAGNHFTNVYRRLIQQFRDIVENHLQLIYTDSERQRFFTLQQESQEAALRLSEERLRSLQAELECASRLSSMGALAGSIIHEINQPLTAINASAEACLRWLGGNTPNVAEAREAASRIFQFGQRASETVTGLRALARQEPARMAELDIHGAIHEVLGLFEKERVRYGVAFVAKLQPDARHVVGDRVQLQQILLNLIRNGLEALAETSDRKRRIQVFTHRTEAGELRVSVEDNGCGIKPSQMKKLFEPLCSTKADGMGMGLSICHSIIETHGGRLWAEPCSPHGTAFHFTLLETREGSVPG